MYLIFGCDDLSRLNFISMYDMIVKMNDLLRGVNIVEVFCFVFFLIIMLLCNNINMIIKVF